VKSLLKDIIRPVYYYIKNKNVREFYKLYDKLNEYKRYTEIKNVKFLSFIFDIPDYASFVWQFKEIFVDELYKFETKKREPVIYDCGANIGMSCLYLKKLYPNAKIKAFEADPYIVKIFENNLKRNNIFDNIEIINSAVWIDNNGLEFSCEGADGGSIYGSNNKIKVKSVKLKEYLENEKEIDFLKIDIEGAEYEVLKDCANSLHCVRHIFIEYHSFVNDHQKLSEILTILEKNGFRYYIQNLKKINSPFVNQNSDNKMDLQLNIFGVKEK